jgi:nucleotide-binding universal stress UspA family protein
VSRAFLQRCADARVGSREARIVVEEPLDAVVRQGQCSDLVVVGQHEPGSAIEGVAADFAQQVFLHTGTPTLVVPHAGSFPSTGRCVLVAWKETPQAVRAIRDALPLLRVAQRVVLCAVAEHEEDDDMPGRFDPVRLWLATHGVEAEVRREGPTSGVGERLLSLAADVGADLLVAGGYGHTRLREWALGGVTRHLLQHMTVPTLLSH